MAVVVVAEAVVAEAVVAVLVVVARGNGVHPELLDTILVAGARRSVEDNNRWSVESQHGSWIGERIVGVSLDGGSMVGMGLLSLSSFWFSWW